ncbi:MAG: methyltransferase, partial [Planctomycetota bacterium]
HRPVDRVPRELWALPGVGMFRKAELDAVSARFPADTAGPDFAYGASTRRRGVPNTVGVSTDEWGCTFHVAEPGVVGEVKEPLLSTLDDVRKYDPPFELLDGADYSRVNASCAATDRFVKTGTHVRPFERLQFLRGSENLFMDLAYGTPEVLKLFGRLHEFYCREMTMWAATDVDGLGFMDDWGSQTALLIAPDMWRAIFKPLYREYCAILRVNGKYVFFHSDGHITAIYPDLIEIGVHAVNSQLFCMDIEELGRCHQGRVTFWGEIDRQHVLPFGTVDEVRAAVRRVRTALDRGTGGVIAQCEWGVKDPQANIAAVYETWLE